MTKGFVFGKFLPFHKGHEAMINFALTTCDYVSVLVCCSDEENISASTRTKWIKKTYENIKTIEVISYQYSERDLPNTSVSSQQVSKLWSEIFKQHFAEYDIVITSEEYGNYVASFMGIRHIPFDLPKQLFPVSGTAVRNDLFGHWKYLPYSVKYDLAIKVAVLGTESTGKTTLTERLSKHFTCSAVKEAARELIGNSYSFELDDLQRVATAHAQAIDNAIRSGESPLIIMDTDVHITKSYARFTFNKELSVNNKIYDINKAALYLYLNNDVAYVQDGTRLSESYRNLLDVSHRHELKQHHINFVEITGNWEQRFDAAIKIIDNFIKTTQSGIWSFRT